MKPINEVLDIVNNNVLLLTGRDIRDRSRKYQIPISRHYFVYLSDYFLNTKELKSDYSKMLYRLTNSKRSYHKEISEYLGFTKMFVFQSKRIAVDMTIQDRMFRDNTTMLIKEISENLK